MATPFALLILCASAQPQNKRGKGTREPQAPPALQFVDHDAEVAFSPFTSAPAAAAPGTTSEHDLSPFITPPAAAANTTNETGGDYEYADWSSLALPQLEENKTGALWLAVAIVAALVAAVAMGCCLWQRCRASKPGRHTLVDLESGGPHRQVSVLGLFRFASVADMALIVAGAVCSSAAGLVWPAFYVLLGDVLDSFVYSSRAAPEVASQCFVLLAIGAGGMVAGFGSLGCWMLLSERQTNVLRVKYLSALLAQDQSWYDRKNPTQLGAQFTLDVVEYYKGTGERLATLITCVVGFAAGLAVGIWKGWQLALLVLAISPFHGGIVAQLERCVSKIDEQLLTLATEASSVVLESIQAIRTVKTFSGQKREYARFATTADAAAEAGVRKALRSGVVQGLTWCSIFISYGVALWFGCWLIRTEVTNDMQGRKFTGGDVVTTFWSVLIAAMTLGEFGPCWAALSASREAAKRLYAMIDRVPAIDCGALPGSATGTTSGGGKIVGLLAAIEFKDVTFAYPTRPSLPVLSGLNLTIAPGTKVALVGASGQGKSTVISLLQRFYDAEAGSITVGGTPLAELDLAWWRRSAAVVSQQPVMLLGSIFDNIRLGKPNATLEEVRAAAAAANADEFVVQLPYGYDTFVGEGGAALSGGQRQRIAIARAVLCDPKILLLDEATSALDNHNERLVQAALDRLMAGRTVVVVAHRMATVANADKICVFEGGKIVEEGTHAELLAAGGRYTELAAGQLAASCSTPEPELASASTGPIKWSRTTGSVYFPELDEGFSITSTPNESVTDEACASEDWAFATGLVDKGSSTGTAGRQRSDSIGMASTASYRRAANFEMEHEAPTAERKRSTSYHEVVKNTLGPAGEEDAVVLLIPAEEGSATAVATAPADALAELPPVSYARVISYLEGDHTKHWVLAILGSIAIGAHMPVWSIVFSSMINVLYDDDRHDQARDSLTIALVFGGLGLVFFVAAVVQQWGLGVIGEKLTATIKKKAFASILRQETGWFDWFENNSYTLNHRLVTSGAMVQTATIKPVGFGMQALATLISGLAIAFYYGWKLALVGTAVLPLLIATAVVQYKYILSFSGEEKTAFEYAGAVSANALNNIREVQSCVAQDTILEAFAAQLVITGRIGQNRALISGLCYGLFFFTVCGAYAICFWYAAVLIDRGETTLAHAMVVIFAIVVAAVDVGQACAKLLPSLGTAVAAQRDLFKVIDRAPCIPEADVSEPQPQPQPQPQVLASKSKFAEAPVASFENVQFAYPTRPLAPVLNGFSLDISKGETVAIVGASGGGKSTLFNLLLRLYEVGSGTVTVAGANVASMDPDDLRQQLGVVSQEPTLFSATIADNITYGATKQRTESEVITAAKKAGAHEFISALPQGYNTHIGAVNLSGGQKQRIAIARCLVRQPQLLLLDEATSALDGESEALVQKSLDDLMQDPESSVVVIAHRLATVRNADRIVVVGGGVVAEIGTHKQLVVDGGIYAGLCSAALL